MKLRNYYITYPLSNGPPWGTNGAGTGTYGPAWWTCLWGTVIKASAIFPNTRYNTQKITIVVNFMVFGGQHPTTNSNELQLSAHSLYIPIPYSISLNAMMVWYWYKGPPMTIGLPYSIYICCHVSQWIEDGKKWLQHFLYSVLMIFGVLKLQPNFWKIKKKMIGKSLTNR